MGAADVVPGVSGGTIAVVLGIYERLLGAARALAAAAGLLLRGEWSRCRQRLDKVDWWLLTPLAIGVLSTILLAASLIETQLEQRPETMAGLFCGLVAASAVSACRLFEWRSATSVAVMAASAAATFALLGLQSGPVSNPSLPVLAGAGAAAVCAMILPGVSGAFLLLMLGMYGAVINIVTDLRLTEAAALAAGAVTGLALFSTLLGWLLEQARNTVMATMVGLMAGSLRVLWPWPNGVGVISRHHNESIPGTDLSWPTPQEWPAPTTAAAIGTITVLLLIHQTSKPPAINPEPARPKE